MLIRRIDYKTESQEFYDPRSSATAHITNHIRELLLCNASIQGAYRWTLRLHIIFQNPKTLQALLKE